MWPGVLLPGIKSGNQSLDLVHNYDAIMQQGAVGEGRLCPRCSHQANWTKHTRRIWFWTIRSIMWKHNVIHI